MLGVAEDPLIAYGWGNLAIALSAVLFLGVVLTLGYLSRKLEDALTFTFVFAAPVFLMYILSKIL